MTSAEAGNLTAYLVGLRPWRGEERPLTPWTIAAVERLLWLRWCYRTGRFAG